MKKRIIGLLCALALVMGMIPVTAFAAAPVYLALGDSITYGVGLDDEKNQNFAALLANENGFTLENEAVSGATSDDLLKKVSEISELVSNADLITITIGGNDLMNALYEYLLEKWPATDPNHPETVKDVQDRLISGELDESLLSSLMFTLLGFDSAAALETFQTNLTAIVTKIKETNLDVTLVVASQYNPYLSFSSVNGMMSYLPSAFDTQIVKMNTIIEEVAKQNNIIVADVYTAFNGAGENLCNATADPLNLDFHPNADGHALIADTIQGVLDGLNIITGVTIDPETVTVEKGETQSFTATVNGIGSYGNAVNWSIVESVATGTTIGQDGTLTVSKDETLGSLKIRATAKDDPNQYAEATVTITGGNEPTIPEIAIDETNFPDANFREHVKTFDTDNSGSLSEDEIAAATNIDVTNKNITSLKGIEYFTNLQELNCQDNELTELDVSANTELTILNCSNNQLTELDVSANTELTILNCSNNQLTTLVIPSGSSFENSDLAQSFTVDVKPTTGKTWSYDLLEFFDENAWEKVAGITVQNGTLETDGKTVSWTNGAKNPVVTYTYQMSDTLTIEATLTLNYTPNEEEIPQQPSVPSQPDKEPEKESFTGWKQDGAGNWHYSRDDELVTGWLKDGNTWYYLEESGKMATGWKQLNGKWYYFYTWGGMAEGWALNNDIWYYLDSETGAMQTGWKQLNGKWYYLYSWGGMAYNTTVEGYPLGSDGAMK